MNKLLALSIGAAALVTSKLQIMGGVNYFKTHEKISLMKKTILITGGTDGIGWETAKNLRDAENVIVVGRNFEKIKEQFKNYNNFSYMYLDLNDLDKVTLFCEEFRKHHKKLDILINNAGIYNIDYKYTQQGFEQNFGVNYLAPYLLTMKLVDLIPNDKESRIIFVASRAYRSAPSKVDFNLYLQKAPQPYKWYQIYAISKLANIYQASSFAEHLKDTNIKVYCLHPGVVYTNMLQQFNFNKILTPFIWYFTKTIEQGAFTTIYLATTTNEKLKNGYYYKDCNPKFIKSDNYYLFNSTKDCLKQMGYLD